MHPTMLTGAQAVGLVHMPAFQAKWRALHGACPWATACQHPDFVLPWYRLYADRYLPVVVMAYAADGALCGLLALARGERGMTVTAAGDRQAEYQAWLAVPAAGDVFIRSAIPAVRAALPGTDLRLSFLPPGIPLGWCADVAGCVLRPHRRPLMHTEADAMTRQRAKKNHRQNFNRLSRLGRVAFEKVVGEARFAAVLDEICRQYDDRQEALHGRRPFQDDPAKKAFLLALQKRGLLHTSLLTVGGATAAAHIGLLSAGRAVHLGISCHSSVFAAHSPGQLLLAMLGVHLAEEATPVLDLTSGGDKYKEHFATGHDLVFELAVYAGARRRLTSELIGVTVHCLKLGLRAAGYRPAGVLAALGAAGRRLRLPLSGAYGGREAGAPDRYLDDA